MAEEPEQPAPPGSKDSANQSAALSNLSDSHAGDPNAASGASDSADTAKLGAALSGLSVGDSKSGEKEDAGEKKAEVPAKKVKVAQEDVAYLVEHLEVNKNTATTMLKAADGERDKAIMDFVLPKSATPASSV